MKRRLATALSLLIATSVFAQTPISKELQEMRDAISAQQQQIQQLQQQVTNRDQVIQQLQTQVGQAQSAAQQAQQTANAASKQEGPEMSDITGLQHDVTDLKALSGTTVNELQETQKRVAGLESPAAIHFKGITITPGGFVAAETVWRQRATLGDINTPLNSIPFSAAGQARQ